MTLLYNDRRRFVDDMVEGFIAAHAHLVRQVDGGVVAVRPTTEPRQVAVVLAGGAGHYPADAGLVGAGLASGAVIGDVFATPSVHHIVSVAQAAQQGRGVVLCHPSRPGFDSLYTHAASMINRSGIDCRVMAVTDDLGTPHNPTANHRRGGLGTFLVAKIAGAAAAAGRTLDDVATAATSANTRTVSLSALFVGATLPGDELSMLSVPAGRMWVGYGPHGEQGTDERDLPTADGLAEMFLAELLAGTPNHLTVDNPVAVVVSGLGATTPEELFIVYRRLNQLLTEASITPIRPIVGEIQTSLNAAGASCAVLWLNDDLAELWTAPAETPALTRR